MAERCEESLPAAIHSGVGMLRLRRSSATLHSGCTQHDTVLDGDYLFCTQLFDESLLDFSLMISAQLFAC